MLCRLFRRAYKLEGFDNLLAVRVLVNLARGAISELVLVVCRYRIAEHQRVNDPDCTWLHVPMPLIDRPMVTESQSERTRSRNGVHWKQHFCTGHGSPP